MISKLQLNIQMSIFSFFFLQIGLPALTLVVSNLVGKKLIMVVVTFEVVVLAFVGVLFYYFQFVQ